MVRGAVVVFLCVCVSVCGAVECPDGASCADANTCCQMPSGRYGCCPLPNAVCCSDHLHCCHQDTVCDLEHSKCVNKTHILDWVENLAVKQRAVVCPDQESECPDETTCCQMPDGSWGCCPMKNAVCCEDKRHCCPEGTACDLKHSACVTDNHPPSRLLMKFPAHRPKIAAEANGTNDVVCPDKMSSCPDSTTCCQLENESYGCCPMPKAVCCSDLVHCCPEGTSCDVARRLCLSAGGLTAMVTKIPAITHLKPTEGVVPCNESVACASGTTCCKTVESTWACCPLPQAVCCDDHEHCCPHNTLCNLAEGTCDDPSHLLLSVPWMKKLPSFPVAQPNPKCDESYTCRSDETCCKLASGDWACCPMPQAVCCEDHMHCCPSGTVCNLAASSCDDPGKHLLSVPWVRKVASIRLASPAQSCDEASQCPAGTTCCRQSSGTWACCPLPKAVCCVDQKHCCPQGYSCDLAEKSCLHPSLPSMPWFRKQSALTGRQMCDTHSSCPRDDTCCFMNKVGKWGCCPLPKAVCCKEGDHCCPTGYTCNEKTASCARGFREIPWYRKQEAEVADGKEDVKCDSTASCAAGSTCCKLPTGQWGCCPLVKAKCCEDAKHCCPQGYTCNLQSATCIKPTSTPLKPLSHSLKPPPEEEPVVCDQSTRCSGDQTCCRRSLSSWACCPYHKAVCCEDMTHCCPLGHTCDPQAKRCIKEARPTWWNDAL